MFVVVDTAPGPHSRGLPWTTRLAAFLVAGVAGCWSQGTAASLSPGTDATAQSLPWLAVALAAFVLGAALAGWAGLRHHRLSQELRDIRAQMRSIDDMLDVWQWQTDPEHRMTLLRPPQGKAALRWTGVLPGRPLWEVFRSTDEAALRARLNSHAPVDSMEVQCLATADPSTHGAHHEPAAGPVHGTLHGPVHGLVHGQLCARVRTDARGAFAGYVGTLREQPEPVPVPVTLHAASASTSAPMGESPMTASAPADADRPVPALQSDHETFGYTVSHDLRAPIRVVEGFTRIVKEDYGHLLDRIGNDHLERVLSAAARMNSMIDSLLALSKLSSQPLARQPVNLSQLAGYVAEDLRRQSPERSVELQIEPGLQVLGDPTLLRVVLENLLGNAWKYTGKRSEARIWFERGARNGASFSVRDNGAGFDMRFADRLFGVFQRLHSANDFQGTGVGLASVRRIVRRHGGEVWAESDVDSGASFHFTLPQDELRP